MLKRQDFLSEAAARNAFRQGGGGVTRMSLLRGPNNEESYAPPLQRQLPDGVKQASQRLFEALTHGHVKPQL